jgi:hypothetical protein
MRDGGWGRRVDAAVLDENSNVRVRFLVSVSAVLFAVALALLSLVAAALSLVHGYVPGLVVSAVLFVVATVVGVAGTLGLLRSR